MDDSLICPRRRRGRGAASALEAALGQKLQLGLGAGAAEHGIAVREAAEATHDVAVVGRKLLGFGAAAS